MNPSQRIKAIREKLGLTQLQFSEILGIKQGSYSDVERGRVNVSNAIKRTLEEHYYVNVNWIETGKGDMFLSEDEIRKNTKVPFRHSEMDNRIKVLEMEIQSLTVKNELQAEKLNSAEEATELLKDIIKTKNELIETYKEKLSSR